ncbi:TRAP transporter small permease [Alkalihalobacillus deserti]|uniref:TRAP transporter small permease n=1 Tax=Alkalihalobacillus deserti TaxID=2879466 RepID=UPI001D14E9F2|nr:TRAP transporter small permease [Alkalihalobacillus deserti]
METEKKNIIAAMIDRFIDVIDVLASIMMVLLTLVVFAEVVSRYAFSLPLTFSNELTMLLFPWVIFVAAISVTKNEGHLSINVFREKLPPAMQRWAFLFSKLVMLYFSVYMMLSSYRLAESVVNQVMPMLRISRAWLFASLTVSFAFITIILIYQIVLILMNRLEPPREEDVLNDLGHDR